MKFLKKDVAFRNIYICWTDGEDITMCFEEFSLPEVAFEVEVSRQKE